MYLRYNINNYLSDEAILKKLKITGLPSGVRLYIGGTEVTN